MGIKVAKFGGSSVADAAQIRKVAAILEADPERRYLVSSAPGKRTSTDVKVTDLLYRLYEQRHDDYTETLSAEYPQWASSLLNLTQTVEKRIGYSK